MKTKLPIHVCKPFVLFLLFISSSVCGQKIDSTFKSPLAQRKSEIYEIVQQPDGKIILAGDIAFFDSKNVGKIVRLNPDGSLDKTLKAELPADFIPFKMELTSSGNILVYDFSRIIKLGPNGRFKNKIEINEISSVTPLANDKFMVSTWLGGLYRYKSNFSIDSSFPNQDHFADGPITDVAIQDNRLVICGSFSIVSGVPKNDLARLFPNGTMDNTFDTGVGTNDFLIGIEINPVDGKIYPAGGTYINSFGGLAFSGIARLNRDGLIDDLFRPITFAGSINVFFTSDNKIISSGYQGIVRINNDGTTDHDFTSITDGLSSFPNVEQLSDGSLLAASLRRIGGDYGIAKFSAAGIQIPTFNPPLARVGMITSMDRINKKLIIAGEFFMLNKHRTNNVARLNANGSVDINFKAVNNDGSAFQCAVLPDGKVLVSSFYDFSRLKPNGELDATFQFSPFKKLYQIEKFHALGNGKIIAAGPNGLNLLNNDGSEDTTFDEGTGFCCGSSTFGMDVQSSGKPVYGGYFTEYNGTPVNRMVRLNHNGSIDPTLNVGAGPNDQVSKIEVISNDELLVAGWFSEFDGHATPGGLVRLKANGLFDPTFQTGFAPFTPFFDIKEFGEKILVSAYINDKYAIATINQNGATSTDFTLPIQITAINDRTSFYMRDNNTFFILGNLTIEGENRPSLITKIINTPITASSAQSLSTSASEVSRESAVSVKVFPNPSQREIIFDVAKTYDVRIVNFSGEIVVETTINEANNSLDISTLRPDTYVIQLISDKKKRQTSILVKN